ncbi:MAG TPA: hypothetical protein VFA46_00795 [Actinomycetes bacterium]|nr:hypothetical protein [Actinomycetes bacterium]
MRPIRSLATALLVASVAVAGCARSQPDQRDTATGQPPAVTTPATSTPAVTAPPATPAPPKAPGRSASVVLADGRHPVHLKTIDPGRRTITFDLIQMYWGEEAVREAAKDGWQEVDNDYYIRNVNPRLRTLPVRADAAITVNMLAVERTGTITKDVSVSLAELPALMRAHPSASRLFYITVRHDQVVKMAEQYIP